MIVLLPWPPSPMCPPWSRAVSDPYMTVHIKHCQDLESLPTLGEKGHQSHFLTSNYHLLPPRFTSDPSPFHIEPTLLLTFHFPFIPTLLYHPDSLCIHSDSSYHRHTIRTIIFCSYTFQLVNHIHTFASDRLLLSLVPTLPKDASKALYISAQCDTEIDVVHPLFNVAQDSHLNYKCYSGHQIHQYNYSPPSLLRNSQKSSQETFIQGCGEEEKALPQCKA